MDGVYEDDALLAMYVRAGLMAIERYADQTEDGFLLSGADLCKIAGTAPVPNALRKVGRLLARSRLELGREGARWRLRIPNFAKKQFPRRYDVPSALPSASASASASKKTPPLPPSREGGTARAPGKARTTEAPEGLTRDQKASILAWAQQHVASGDLPKGAADPKRLAAWVEACLDHFRAGAKRKADWTATCRNWIRRAAREEMLGKTNGTRHAQAGDQGPAYWRPSKLPETSPSGEPLVRVVRSQEAR